MARPQSPICQCGHSLGWHAAAADECRRCPCPLFRVPDLMAALEESLSAVPPRPFRGRDRCQRIWRDVGDDSPWYEKALFHALAALEMGDNPSCALAKIEKALAERPSEIAALPSRETDAPKETT